MGVIRKKTANRGGEGGVKYVCDVCSADITSTVRIRCAHNKCNEYDLCVQCFADGAKSHNHDPPTHPFNVIEQNSVPIYDKEWGADEELLLLEGAEIYGLGSWSDIADHIGGYRTKDEVAEHYGKVYLKSKKFPLPENASPSDKALLNQVPREMFQARKKARIEDKRQAAKNAPPPQPKHKPTASVPSCHEVQGYMPGRLEFETEYANEAEEAVQHMQFDPGDGINPRTGELEPEMDLKMTVIDIYNTRLTQRADRKKIIFEHNLLDYRKNAALEKKRTKEERDLLTKTKPYARMMNKRDFEELQQGIQDEHNLRQAIAQLQDWREKKVIDLAGGEKYEQDKVIRAQKAVPMGSMDRERFASSARMKPAHVIETPSGASALVAPELPIRLIQPSTPPKKENKVLTNGHTNGITSPVKREKLAMQPLASFNPIPMSQENSADLHLLTTDEIQLCEVTRLHPKPYMVIKEAIMKEALKGNGLLKRKQVTKELCKVDPSKMGRIFDFFVSAGWIGKA
ncbi:hypothetical protein BJ878DRAFT_112712 [Calycina marina]|uniref:Transcriptional adapter 2 n=1 Tax=Calycina marina TaxID=1763456 RepID=A0A9P7Z1X9_9HELO|nr:hypothetical protein BJ878DRAFT_112712 [Calycina marina]